ESWFSLFQHGLTSKFTFNDMYAYQPGDMLHTFSIEEEGNMPLDHTFYRETVKQCTVLAVDNSLPDKKFEVACRTRTLTANSPGEIGNVIPVITADTLWWGKSNLPFFS